MLISGIIGGDEVNETANMVNSILASTGKKLSMVDFKSLNGLDARTVRDYTVELGKNHVDILVLKINISDYTEEVFNSLTFDIMIFTYKTDNNKEVLEKAPEDFKRSIFSSLDEKGIVLVNINDSELVRLLENMKYCILTYGFNSKAAITTSSIGDIAFKDSFMCCLQKSIFATDGVLIEPQEYRMNVESNAANSESVLAAASFAIINGVDLNSLEKG